MASTDLIINSGIQYIHIPVNFSEERINKVRRRFADKEIPQDDGGPLYRLMEVYHWEEEDMLIDKDSINEEAYSHFGELNPEAINSSYVEEVEETKSYSVSGKEALVVCERHWVPLPYFRVRGDIDKPFHYGPENWCRMNIQPQKNEKLGTTHVLVLAFDTSAEEDDSPEYYKPKFRDATDNGNERFKCVFEKRHALSFFTSSKLWNWMYYLYELDEDRANRNKHMLKHVATYYALLELLKSTDLLPEVGLLSGEKDEKPIEVALTIDIGNSRTCGLLCEKSRPFELQPFDFTSARRLQIRNLSEPHKVCEEPFEMQVAFSEENFGIAAKEIIDDAFDWPSLVRVGPEAIGLTSYFESEDSQATISSPKRYLWDKSPVKIPWIKVDSERRVGYHKNVHIKEKALYGIALYLTDSGRRIKNPGLELGARDSRYSRSSIMMFAVYEILLHAINQINSPEFRRDQGNSTYRRVLKDVIITCPTAMTVQEQYVLRKSVKDAIELIYITMEDKLDFSGLQIEVHPELPSLDLSEQDDNPWKKDEAMASQLAFLYGELIHKYASKVDIFFNLHGKFRQDENKKSVNIASIDIGGGTTDLMICNYTYDAESPVPFLTPKPIFWEGFSLAGDDIVKRIIEIVIIPTIKNDIEEKGGLNVVSVINELFGENIGGKTAIEKIYRKQFANMVAATVVYKIFNYLIKPGENDHAFKIKDVFKEFEEPKNRLIEYINKKIRNQSDLSDYDIREVDIQIDVHQINEGIQDILNEVLKQLSFLVAHFDCDLLLLSGRPSRLPVITSILNSTLNFSADRIVNLGNYRFGNWYPFADSTGYVDDPKSTVSVGALIAYLNDISRLPGMRFDFKHMNKIKSTANYIGLIHYDKGLGSIKDEDLIFAPNKQQGAFKFYGEPIAIGMRQLKSESWVATSLYLFDFKDEESRKRVTKEYKFPYKLQFDKVQSHGEFIDKGDLEVYDSEGGLIDQYNFNFSLHTSNYFQLHWKDSGSFITPIE